MNALLTSNLETHFQLYENEIYRTVEDQSFATTRKLLDSDEEQRILEEILEQAKPLVTTHNARGELHYLLYTPFRYPPLKAGGRFHTRFEQSIFYAAETLKTSMAERAYGIFLFMHHTEADFSPMEVGYTHFVAKVKSARAILLTTPSFDADRGDISHPTSYAFSQQLGVVMRQSKAELFTYYSARIPGGINVGLFSTEAFSSNKPLKGKDKHWSVYVSKETIEFKCTHLMDNEKESHVFKMEDFCIDGKFPIAA